MSWEGPDVMGGKLCHGREIMSWEGHDVMGGT